MEYENTPSNANQQLNSKGPTFIQYMFIYNNTTKNPTINSTSSSVLNDYCSIQLKQEGN